MVVMIDSRGTDLLASVILDIESINVFDFPLPKPRFSDASSSSVKSLTGLRRDGPCEPAFPDTRPINRNRNE